MACPRSHDLHSNACNARLDILKIMISYQDFSKVAFFFGFAENNQKKFSSGSRQKTDLVIKIKSRLKASNA